MGSVQHSKLLQIETRPILRQIVTFRYIHHYCTKLSLESRSLRSTWNMIMDLTGPGVNQRKTGDVTSRDHHVAVS